MEEYYKKFMPFLEGYTVQGLFSGDRTIDKIVTLQTGNRGRVFFFDQEPIIADMDVELWDHVFAEPTILANSELDSNDKKWLADRYPNFIDWYFFSHALVCREWFAHYKNCEAGNYSNHEIPFLTDFGIVTRQRQYRILLYKILSGMFDKFYFSIDADQPWQEDLLNNDTFGIINDYPHSWKNIIPSASHSYDDFGKNATLPINNFKQNLISFEHYSKVDFVLVQETAFQTKKKHLTEKIFKPIIAGKPFILAGAAGNLEYLKRYKFKTFSALVDESYDNIKDDKSRCFAIKNTIKNILYRIQISEPENLNRIFEECNEISRYNRKWFWSDDFLTLVFSEAVNNLSIAKSKFSVLSKSENSRFDDEALKVLENLKTTGV